MELKDEVTKGRIERILLFEVVAKLCETEARDDITEGKVDAELRFATDIAGLEELEDERGVSAVGNATELETEGFAADERFLPGRIAGGSVPDAIPKEKLEGLLL